MTGADGKTAELQRRKSERAQARADEARMAKPEVAYSSTLRAYAVTTLNVAKVTAHEHYNVTYDLKTVLEAVPLGGLCWWYPITGRNGRTSHAAEIGQEPLMHLLDRMRPVHGCPDLWSLKIAYRKLFEAAEKERPSPKPADPAPDTEIAPPDRERRDLFDKVPPGVDDPSESWVINRIVHKLTSRGDLPDLLRTDLIQWNDDRRERLRRETRKRGGGEDEIERIFAMRKPE